jgi:hypothetical protein
MAFVIGDVLGIVSGPCGQVNLRKYMALQTLLSIASMLARPGGAKRTESAVEISRFVAIGAISGWESFPLHLVLQR